MDEKDIQYRAGFAILMAARAHTMRDNECPETDEVLGLACKRISQEIWFTRGGNYTVYWTVKKGDKIEECYAGQQITISAGKKKYTYVKQYTENGQ